MHLTNYAINKKNPKFINAYQLMGDCYIEQKNWKDGSVMKAPSGVVPII